MVPLSLTVSIDGSEGFEELTMPASEGREWPTGAEAGNVARLYARMAADLRNGSRTAPTFEDAVALHQVLSAIEAAAGHLTPVAPQ